MGIDAQGNLYPAEYNNNVLYELPVGSSTLITLVTGGSLSNPESVAVDAAGNIYVGNQNQTVVRYSAGTYAATILNPTGQFIAIDGAGTIYDTNSTTLASYSRVTSPPLTFPSTAVGSTSAAKTVTLENDGNAPLSVSVPGSGVNPSLTGPYVLGNSSTCPQVSSMGSALTLASGATCTDVITFQPTAVSATNPGTLTTSDNSNNVASTQVVTLSGTSTQGSQTINFPQPATPGQAGSSATLMATASSGLAVTYTITSGPATISGSTVTYTGVGTVMIGANQAGNANYSAAPTVSATVTTTAAPAAYTAPTQPVGTASPTQTAYVTVTTAGTPGAINVLTQGAANMDFQFVSGGTCATATAYTVGQICTVLYTFTPSHPGVRLGGITLTLTNSAGSLLGNSYVVGQGTGPQVTFPNQDAGSVLHSGFYNPYGVAVDGSGNVFVADTNNNAVKEIVAAGGYTTVKTLGSGFNHPYGVAVDGSGNVFVADANNNAVKEIVAAGGYTTVNTLGGGFSYPSGVAVDGGGNVFVADSNNNAVKEIAAVGGYTTVNTLGNAFNNPYGVAVDGSGNVFVADRGSNAVKELNFATAPSVAFPTATVVGSTDTTDGTKVVTLNNDGTSALSIASIAPSNSDFTFTGTASSTPFPSTAACGTTLASGAFCSIGITFTPQTGGANTANGNVTDNNLNVLNAVQAIALSGTGSLVPQTINFPQPATPAQAGTSATLMATASSGLAVTYSITSGPATISGSTVTYTGAGTVVIAANQSGNATYAAAATVSDTVTTTAAPATYTVPAQPVGTTSPTQTAYITITNAGQQAYVDVMTTGQYNLDYALVSGGTCSYGTNYAFGATCTVNYTFTPRAPGQRLGAIQILSASNVALGTSLLVGTGTGAAAAFPGNTATATLATGFGNVIGIAVDAAGDVYVPIGSVVREIVAVGGSIPANPTIRTLGSGFTNPYGVAVDGAGNVYVADTGNGVVREILAAGGSTSSSSPTRTLGSGFSGPNGVAVDGAGNVYVADTTHNLVKEIVAVGGSIPISNPTINTIGSGFISPVAVAVDGAGNVYVANYGNGKVQEIVAVGGSTSSSSTVRTLGSGFNSTYGVAVDAAGNVYVGDRGNGQVKEIVAVGGSIPTSNPTILTLGSGFNLPSGVAVDGAGNVYVADSGSSAAKQISLATPPGLAFPSTTVGSTSSPLAVQLQNVGNAALLFPAPSSGSNPLAGPGFVLDGSTTCPIVAVNGTPGSLASGALCSEAIDSRPTASGSYSSTLQLTDNSLTSGTSTQSIPLSGTGTQIAQTITFPQPATPAQAGTSATLMATASSGLPVTYTVTSGPATISGSTVTYTGVGTVVIAANQAGNANYAAAPTLSDSVQVQQRQSIITWNPASHTGYNGVLIGADVLDATSATAGTFAYTATLAGGSAVAITGSSVLAVGSYTLTANFSPTDATNNTSATATMAFAVVQQEVFVVNSGGTVTSMFDNGAVQSSAVSGGGIGAAVDASGFVWSINANGNGVSKFTDTGTLATSYTGAGTSAATALAIDGLGRVFVTNGDGTVNALTNTGGAVYTNPVAAASSISAPTAVSVDSAGSLWIASSGDNSAVEMIGIAAPVVTPAVNAVKNANPGTRP